MNNIDLSIIIVNYNVKEFLQNLLGSIHKSAKNIATEIIVVDNSSDDGSVESIKEKFPDVKLIANKENVGFGVANNQGLKIAKGRLILLLNPDTIVQEDTFQKLIEFFNNTPDAGLAGCKIINSDGSLQLACRRSFPGPWTSFCKVTGLSKLFPKSRLFSRYNLTYLDENKTYEVDAISGAFMMFRREVYEKVGGFDPQFFMYGEDLDLCYRTQKAGYKVYYVHSTQIIHYKGESTKRSSLDETKVFYDAMHLFVKKHFSTSLLVQFILDLAIILRQVVAFINVYKFVLIAIIFDFIFFDVALFLADKLYASPHWHGFPDNTLLTVYTLPALIQIIISSLLGSYRKDSFSVLRILYSIFIGFFIVSSTTYFFKQYAYSRAIVIITYLILFLIFPIWRIVVKSVFKFGLKAELSKTRTLVVGTNQESINLALKLKARFTTIHNIIGLIGKSRKYLGKQIENFEVVGSLENIRKVIRENQINEVIFSSSDITYSEMLAVVSKCQGENVEFKVAGNELDFLVGKSSITMLDDIPLLNIYYNISSVTSKLSKFFFDFIIAFPILILIFPFVLVLHKVTKKKSDLINFVLSIPSIFARQSSLVGPQTNRDINLYLGKKGLTGLWYTEGFDSKDKDEAVKLDIFYAKNQNIWLDLEILGKTISKMLNN
ncbi:MAG: glycosyltransferase [Ignavibacteriales bacterium]|nr:glycosyltransferase [Ignavibacteriales bacterium]